MDNAYDEKTLIPTDLIRHTSFYLPEEKKYVCMALILKASNKILEGCFMFFMHDHAFSKMIGLQGT